MQNTVITLKLKLPNQSVWKHLYDSIILPTVKLQDDYG